MIYTYMGSKCNSFDAISEKPYFLDFGGLFCEIEKMLNIYNMVYIGFEISTPKLTRINQKTLYMSKNMYRYCTIFAQLGLLHRALSTFIRNDKKPRR